MSKQTKRFTRVFLQILDSSIAEDFMVRHVFEDFFKICDYKTGVLDMTRQAISRRLNVPIDVLNQSIAKLESPDTNSRDQSFEGRRIQKLDDHRDWGWRILNWDKYATEQKKAENAERVADMRTKPVDFVAPHIQEVVEFSLSIGLTSKDGEGFYWGKESANPGGQWMNGKTPLRDWKATMRNWKARGFFESQKKKTSAVIL
jgi:hypothetical protein